tara:strand:- start:172 stop:426 length:255 start_codon:yes stop_codon:yes gene_type:complete
MISLAQSIMIVVRSLAWSNQRQRKAINGHMLNEYLFGRLKGIVGRACLVAFGTAQGLHILLTVSVMRFGIMKRATLWATRTHPD